MHRKKKLARKFILCFLLMGVSISTISVIVGVNGFGDYIKKQYNDTAYDVAETVQTFFEEDELAAYVELLQEPECETHTEQCRKVIRSERYQNVLKQIDNLRVSMGAADIFVAAVDLDQLNETAAEKESWAPLCYLFDTYKGEDITFDFGERGAFNPLFIKDIKKQMETGSRASNYYISKSRFGYNTSAVLPVPLADSELPVLICVEIPMSTLRGATVDLSVHTLGMIVIVMGLVLLLFVFYLYRTVIRPIDIIAGETDAFGDSGEQLSGRLQHVQTGDELQELAESVLRMEQGILDHVKHITAVTAEKERISTELNVAAEIQANMLPGKFPAFPKRREFDLYASMTPAKEVGGDFYDFFLADHDHLVMVVGDVSGKGVPAALYMVISKTLIKNGTNASLSPGEILEEVNEQLCENNDSDMFVTVWLGIMEIPTGRVVAANAGHEFPAIRKDDGTFVLLKDPHGFVLGGMERVEYREYEFELRQGEALFVYTDGVPEATNGEEELFGTDRMLEILNQNPHVDPEQKIWQIKAVIDAFVGEAPQFDDITMLLIERK